MDNDGTMNGHELWLAAGLRTPFARVDGPLARLDAVELSLPVVRAMTGSQPAIKPDLVVWGTVIPNLGYSNIAREVQIESGLDQTIPAFSTVLACSTSMVAAFEAAGMLGHGGKEPALVGGVESMSRAPLVMPKPVTAFSRNAEIHDTTLGWRFANPVMQKMYGTASMGETAENVAEKYAIKRSDQDAFALRSQQRTTAAQKTGFYSGEIAPVEVALGKGKVISLTHDEHPRPDTTLEGLARLPTPFREAGTVTAGNASGINDGACAMFVASETAAAKFGLNPIARIAGANAAGVDPNVMGIGPIPATRKLLARLKLIIDDIDFFKLNEAFASQVLAITRDFGLPDDSEKVNPNGGAIALGHPLGMSGARLVLTAARQLQRSQGRYALASMCVGVGQGMAMVLERV